MGIWNPDTQRKGLGHGLCSSRLRRLGMRSLADFLHMQCMHGKAASCRDSVAWSSLGSDRKVSEALTLLPA